MTIRACPWCGDTWCRGACRTVEPFYGRCRVCGGNMAECVEKRRHVEATTRERWRLVKFIRESLRKQEKPR